MLLLLLLPLLMFAFVINGFNKHAQASKIKNAFIMMLFDLCVFYYVGMGTWNIHSIDRIIFFFFKFILKYVLICKVIRTPYLGGCQIKSKFKKIQKKRNDPNNIMSQNGISILFAKHFYLYSELLNFVVVVGQ